ncbi:MAG: RND family efflux transporter MFP subunit, partial [Parcubacteria group bacterium GW2011_GWA1_44_13]
MKKVSKRQLLWVGGIIIGIIIVGIWWNSRSSNTDDQNTLVVKRDTIIQEVNVTGRIEPITSVDLGFEKSGRIQHVYTNTNQRVTQGALLAELESSSAEAGLLEQEARLAELKRGARPEEIAIKETELAKYEQDLINAYNGISDIATDSFSKADDALHTKMTGIFSGFKTTSYDITYQVCDSQLDNDVVALKYQAEIDFDAWRTEMGTNNFSQRTSSTELNLLAQTENHLKVTKAFLEGVSRTLTLDCTIVNTDLDTYRTNVNTARTNINTVLATINTKKQAISSLTLTAIKTRNELALLRSGTATEVIEAQEARVLGARGELAKYKIYAPINGTVRTMDAHVGEYANASSPLISIISDTSFKIEANVPEADIAKIHVGDQAKITLDAYGSDVIFEGHVTIIDTAETIIDNVPTYKVTLAFDKNDARIKSGMTANIDIATAQKENVLSVPQRAVINKNGQKTVVVVNDDSTNTETIVTTGLRGSNGFIEIVE